MLGRRHLGPRTLTRQLENWTPVKRRQSSRVFLKERNERALYSKEVSKSSTELRARGPKCILKRGTTVNLNLSRLVKQ